MSLFFNIVGMIFLECEDILDAEELYEIHETKETQMMTMRCSATSFLVLIV